MHDTHEHIDPNKKTLEILKKKKEESHKNAHAAGRKKR